VQLETERLILRDFTLDDVEAFAACAADPDARRFYEERDVDEEARELVEMFVAWQREEPRSHYQMAVILKTNGQLIGTCGLRQRQEVDYGGGSPLEGDIGYNIHLEHRRQGYATEACRAMLRFGFEDMGLRRVWTFCLAENEASWRVMERIGMRREGLLRDNVWLRGRAWDTAMYAILKDEWAAQQKP
jgi:ribosomal-protein-alanine N-acetyltransferase